MQTEDKYFIFDRPEERSWKYYAKSALYCCSSLWYKLLMNLKKPEIKNKQHKVSICAIFKNEAIYLKEWIEYHKIVGVEHFYLYNNNSEDNYEDILKPYIADGQVTLTQWPQNQAQTQCYQDCTVRFSSETEWLAFIDIDEFIVPNTTDNIYDYLKPFQQNRPVVIAYWKMFGTSGKITRDTTRLVTEDFTICWNKYVNIGKIFFNTAYHLDFNSTKNSTIHSLWSKYKNTELPPVNIFDKICTFGKNQVQNNTDASIFPLQINHYFTKTYSEYQRKKARGDAYFKINPHDEAYFFRHEIKNQASDYHIFKYLVKLKLALGIER